MFIYLTYGKHDKSWAKTLSANRHIDGAARPSARLRPLVVVSLVSFRENAHLIVRACDEAKK